MSHTAPSSSTTSARSRTSPPAASMNTFPPFVSWRVGVMDGPGSTSRAVPGRPARRHPPPPPCGVLHCPHAAFGHHRTRGAHLEQRQHGIHRLLARDLVGSEAETIGAFLPILAQALPVAFSLAAHKPLASCPSDGARRSNRSGDLDASRRPAPITTAWAIPNLRVLLLMQRACGRS